MRIYSDKVILGGGVHPLRVGPATLDVTGSTITAVHPGPAAPSGDEPSLLDYSGYLLAPAFINTHTHLVLSCLRGVGGLEAHRGNVVENLYYQVESQMTAEDVRAFARVAALDCLLSGTAIVWDHYYHGREIAGALQDMGLSGVVAPTLQDLQGPGAADWEEQLETTLWLDEQSSLEEAGIVAALGPHAMDTVSDALWRRVATVAEERNLPIHAHVAQSLEEVERSLEQHGQPPLARLHALGPLQQPSPFLLVHGLYADQESLQALDGRRHVLGYCPYSQLQFAFRAHIAAWRDAGVRLALGTDAGCCNDTMNVQLELRSLAAGHAFSAAASPPYESFMQAPTLSNAHEVQAGRQACFEEAAPYSEPQQCLASVWSTPGSLHPKLRAGSIEAGHRANLLFIDPNHPSLWPATDPLRSLTLSDVGPAIHGLMVNGRWRGTPGDFHRSITQEDDAKSAIQEANERLAHLLQRCGLQGR